MFDNLAVCQAVLNALPDATLLKDRQQRLVFLNRKACELLGKTAAEMLGKTALEGLPAPLVADILAYDRIVMETGEPAEFEEQFINTGNETLTFVVRSTRIYLFSEPYLLVSLNDITALRAAESQTRFLAYHDILTGLHNRTALYDQLNHALVPVTVDEGLVGGLLVLMDLDGFKNINDTYGHQAGDYVLCEFARRLQQVAPVGSLVARMGGDEFALIIQHTLSMDAAQELCLNIVKLTHTPFSLLGASLYVSVSVGATFTGQFDITAGEMLRKADAALYEAKRQGKNVHCFYSESLDASVTSKRRMEKALALAIACGTQITCAYQPLIRSADNKIVGVEALARWSDADLGEISPVQFIPLAEETGQIIPLGQMILRQACRDMRQWDDLSVSVNLSPIQLRDGDFAQRVLSILAQEQFPPERLELELTETAIMNSDDNGKQQLALLRKEGVRISLDDFGTGYSTLSLLKDIAVDSVKIDRSFVQFVTQLKDTAAIVTAVSNLGVKLNLQVIAEGVETKEQQQFLRDAGCTQMQGFLFSKPLDKEEFERFFASVAEEKPPVD
ncbi:EAL domain-containing protein [Acerihabitans sp. TG2]|uniref:sensor domain-containing protein n=1 Tax=Acerihabitans sp. TG2 TaxID=3096008 RepID=UPI002B22BF42|nr:EAL domain-containing protein [Acerihabitans sp. TG2]MEA9391626.1 EAL domain-containing protein [Acerihabitans sp. TG2]